MLCFTAWVATKRRLGIQHCCLFECIIIGLWLSLRHLHDACYGLNLLPRRRRFWFSNRAVFALLYKKMTHPSTWRWMIAFKSEGVVNRMDLMGKLDYNIGGSDTPNTVYSFYFHFSWFEVCHFSWLQQHKSQHFCFLEKEKLLLVCTRWNYWRYQAFLIVITNIIHIKFVSTCFFLVIIKAYWSTLKQCYE